VLRADLGEWRAAADCGYEQALVSLKRNSTTNAEGSEPKAVIMEGG